MSQERWDVVLKVLDGPLAGLGEQVLRGPVVRIGVNPGPGGLQLTGYRGLDARHAVITAYDGGTATIGPVGTNQVRIAPHANVNWKEIDPVTSPQYLNNGGAIHLGPVGRGATMEFVKCQKLGVWVKGDLASEADGVRGGQGGPSAAGQQFQQANIPAAYNARKVGSIRTSTAPFWFVGCLFLLASGSVALIATIAIVVGTNPFRQIEELGPKEEGQYFRDFAKVDKEQLESLGLLEGLHQPFEAFVMLYNAEAADKPDLRQPETWDEEFYDRVAASVHQHVQWKKVFRRFEEIKDDYALVTGALQEAGLPEVFAGIPYRESTYTPDAQSDACAKGWWQFMPEVAYRLEAKEGMDFRVDSCAFKDGGSWSPKDEGLVTPPRNVFKNAKYINAQGKCRISKCSPDDRTDLEKSTAAAMFTLKEAWDDEDLRASGALVQIVIASHNGGYADGRFGVPKTSNLKPAFVTWSKKHDESEWHKFYGENITCAEGPPGYCGDSPLHSETQHYVYPIVARHILAVCYYGKNHSDIKPFTRWSKYLEADGYCSNFKIPDPGDLK